MKNVITSQRAIMATLLALSTSTANAADAPQEEKDAVSASTSKITWSQENVEGPPIASTLRTPDEQPEGKGSLTWSVTPYAWALNTSVDLSALDTGASEHIDMPFDELLDVLDGVFLVQTEVGKGNWSAFVDYNYLATSETLEQPVVDVLLQQETTFVDGVVAYWPNGVGSELNFYGGARYSRLDNRLDLELEGERQFLSSASNDYTDALVGARYRHDFSDRWSLLTRGDISYGESEGSWLAESLVEYKLGGNRDNRLMLGYRHKEAEFVGDGRRLDYEFGGLIAGFRIRF